MEKILKALQRLQTEAFKKGIHSFYICGWNQTIDGENIQVVYVTIFRDQDRDDDNYYFSCEFRHDRSDHDALLADVKSFINL